MGKRVEGENLNLAEIVKAYVFMGLGDLFGKPGDHTVIEHEHDPNSETIEMVCLPGRFGSSEFQSLLVDAGLLRRNRAQAA